jgi:hypothetical protein
MSNKSIHQLIPDIYQLVGKRDGWFNEILASDMGREISLKCQERFAAVERKGSLRLSKLGPECPCALWHSVHHPELAEKVQPWAMIKFMYGDILEALVIALAKAAGHTVEGEQDAVVVDGIVGHRDCIIDGCLVDVKSANSRSFEKFKSKAVMETDVFTVGYLDQLDAYLVGSADDPRLRVKDRGYLLAIDKVLGHMVLYEHHHRPDYIQRRIAEYKEVVGRPTAPACTCQTVADGKSGNFKLDVKASYNPYKYCCRPNIRTFAYSDGPRYLTTVVREPDVQEIDKNGKLVYNGTF